NGAVDPIKDDFNAGSFATGFAVAIALLGAALGAWFAGRLADRWGRIKVMVVASAAFAISSVLSAFSVTVYDLSVYRFLGGMAIGAASVIAPAYIAEIAPARMRGRLGSMQ